MNESSSSSSSSSSLLLLLLLLLLSYDNYECRAVVPEKCFPSNGAIAPLLQLWSLSSILMPRISFFSRQEYACLPSLFS
jgi:hypothetical protein